MKNYRDQLKSQVKKDKASHDTATKLTELRKSNVFHYYTNEKREKEKTPIQKSIARVYFNLLCHLKDNKGQPKTTDYRESTQQ